MGSQGCQVSFARLSAALCSVEAQLAALLPWLGVGVGPQRCLNFTIQREYLEAQWEPAALAGGGGGTSRTQVGSFLALSLRRRDLFRPHREDPLVSSHPLVTYLLHTPSLSCRASFRGCVSRVSNRD